MKSAISSIQSCLSSQTVQLQSKHRKQNLYTNLAISEQALSHKSYLSFLSGSYFSVPLFALHFFGFHMNSAHQ